MFFKALIAFLVLPGLVAGLVPGVVFYIDPWRGATNPFGLFVMAAGLFIQLWCIRDFYVAGKGTLAPWSPPKHLVVIGLYRFCRNPMYVGVLILIAGWAMFANSAVLIAYLLILFLSFHFRVIRYEEPRLLKLFGPDWETYAAAIPRWLPKFK